MVIILAAVCHCPHFSVLGDMDDEFEPAKYTSATSKIPAEAAASRKT